MLSVNEKMVVMVSNKQEHIRIPVVCIYKDPSLRFLIIFNRLYQMLILCELHHVLEASLSLCKILF